MTDYKQALKNEKLVNEINELSAQIISEATEKAYEVDEDEDSQKILMQRMQSRDNYKELLMGAVMANVTMNMAEAMQDRRMQKKIRQDGWDDIAQRLFVKTMSLGFLSAVELTKALEEVSDEL